MLIYSQSYTCLLKTAVSPIVFNGDHSWTQLTAAKYYWLSIFQIALIMVNVFENNKARESGSWLLPEKGRKKAKPFPAVVVHVVLFLLSHKICCGKARQDCLCMKILVVIWGPSRK